MCLIFLVLTLIFPSRINSVPRFDPSALLQNILVPADAAVGSIIYRLRASDPTFDYPLTFTLGKDSTSSAIKIESLNCTRFNSVCQANVILVKKLEVTRFYDFVVTVQSVSGGVTTNLNCSFRATNATTPWGEIFPGAPTLLMVSEKSRRNTDLGTLIARGNPDVPDPVYLELWGGSQFGLHQKLVNSKDAEGTIVLLSQLDYETKSVHHLTILSNNPFSYRITDTRNIAGWPLLVVVLDEQDTPPIFTLAPPTTVLNPTLKPGDLVLQVKAEDGDRGNPREIRYSIKNDDIFSDFFEINEVTGEIHMVRQLSELISLTHSNRPLLLNVVAEEVRENPKEPPAQSTTVKLAMIPPSLTGTSPIFGSPEYTTILDENSAIGTILKLPQAKIQTQPGDVVTLDLESNNGTFEISPNIVEGDSDFQIIVHNSNLLDFEERKSVACFIVAREIGNFNLTSRSKLTVLLNDVNDNFPVFSSEIYEAAVQENAAPNTFILRVEARDVDSEPGNKIKYALSLDEGSNYFQIDAETGIITSKNGGLDAERIPEFNLIAEATDENGHGHSSRANVKIKLVDLNDNPPIFDKEIYEFIINPERVGFTTIAEIKAFDKDISWPNNEVHYELVDQFDGLIINELTGELSLTKTWSRSDLVALTGRAWDAGIPRLTGNCTIRIYPTDTNSRRMIFIVPGADPDVETISKTLRTITGGGKVTINDVHPYNSDQQISDATDLTREGDSERSVVVATVNYSKGTVIDVKKIQEVLDREYQTIHHNRGKSEIKEGSGGNLLWLLVLLIFLLLLLAFILLCCCLWDKCPCYSSFNKRHRIGSSVEKIKIISSPGLGHETKSKSVQVAPDWLAKRDAWSPGPITTLDVESLRRHEMERGSDRVSRNRVIISQKEPPMNEFYTREGNVDILRLYTSKPDQNGAQNLNNANANYFQDSGKEILMRRYIEQQQQNNSMQTGAQNYDTLLPNAAVSKLQSEHEALEASLRKQNELLKQILSERERDLKLETQSLPAGTQTDQDVATQTEPNLTSLLPPKREVQSNDEASDGDEDLEAIKEKIKKRTKSVRHPRNHRQKRRVRTPIEEQEEEFDDEYVETSGESGRIRREILREITESLRYERRQNEMLESDRILSNLRRSLSRNDLIQNLQNALTRHNRAMSMSESNLNSGIQQILQDSVSRQNELENLVKREEIQIADLVKLLNQPQNNEELSRSKSAIKREILDEINAELKQKSQRTQSESRVAVTDNKERVDSKSRSETRRNVATLNAGSHREKVKNIEYSDDSLDLEAKTSGESKNGKVKDGKPSNNSNRQSRYMEWYNKNKKQENKTIKNPRKATGAAQKQAHVEKEKEKISVHSSSRLLKETESSARKKQGTKKQKGAGGGGGSGGNSENVGSGTEHHPLLQHSEHRFEPQYHRRLDDDVDSGIAMTKPAITQKKSVFTIAYDDMHTSQIQDNSTNTPPLV